MSLVDEFRQHIMEWKRSQEEAKPGGYIRTPEIREKQSVAALRARASKTPEEIEEWCGSLSRGNEVRWANTSHEERVKFGERVSGAWTPEMRKAASKRRSEMNHQRWVERLSQGLPYLYEGQVEAMAKALRKRYSDPELRDKMQREMAAGRRIHPNSKEDFLLDKVETIAPGEWRFNDGWFILAGKVPDLVNERRRQLMEVFGNYWHEAEEEEERVTLFGRLGWKCLVIWDGGLYYGSLDLTKKLKTFIGGGG